MEFLRKSRLVRRVPLMLLRVVRFMVVVMILRVFTVFGWSLLILTFSRWVGKRLLIRRRLARVRLLLLVWWARMCRRFMVLLSLGVLFRVVVRRSTRLLLRSSLVGILVVGLFPLLMMRNRLRIVRRVLLVTVGFTVVVLPLFLRLILLMVGRMRRLLVGRGGRLPLSRRGRIRVVGIPRMVSLLRR